MQIIKSQDEKIQDQMFCIGLYLMIDYFFLFLFLARALKKYVVDFKITSLIFSGSLLESQKIICVKLLIIDVFLEHLEYS